ncbi:MAG: glutathione synthase [Myxococcales bacterium]|nr:glutathione synthase [Myxococcales bacterium]
MRLLVVMDPVSTVQVDGDTSFALMLEAQGRGHHVDHCQPSDLDLLDGRVRAWVRRATMQRDAAAPITLGEPELVDLGQTHDVILVRKDPPFDSDYLWLTLLLERLRGERPLVVNDPRGLRDANEKLYACHFPELTPRTLVSADKARIRAFVDEVGGRAVIKPIDGHGGEGVFALMADDKNFNGLVEHVTRLGRRLAMVQAFLPEVTEGDKRILLIDGEVIGAILRVPRSDDVRSNMHVGGSVKPADLSDADRHIIATVTPRLRADGLFFVGLDVIGGKLTEVNVTSPTGIQQMSRFAGRRCEAPVIDWLERRVGAA